MLAALARIVNALSLRTQLAIGAVLLAAAATIMLTAVIGRVAVDRVSVQAGQAALANATQMGELLSRGMFERHRDIKIAASLPSITNPVMPLASKRAVLETLRDTFPLYAWIGLTDTNGKVLVSTDGLLEGQDVHERPWFQDGIKRTIVKDVHEAKLLAKLLPNPDGQPLRFVDVATPVRDVNGDATGVLGAHLSWKWAAEVRDTLLKSHSAADGLEILVLSHDGVVLLGPQDVLGETLRLGTTDAARAGERGFAVEAWPDGVEYLTAYTPSGGYLDYPGAGWIVLARQPEALAHAAATELKWYIAIAGALATLTLGVFGAIGSGTVSRPVLAIADAADKIGQGSNLASLPEVDGCSEVGILSRSLKGLLDKLLSREASLRELNLSLEQRILERTQNLASANAALSQENERRRKLEVELEQMVAELKNVAIRDPLTGIHNRRAFNEMAALEFKRTQRRRTSLSVIMADIDHFKRVNDTHGHLAGDEVLRKVAAVLRQSLREVDILARYGGEEFVIMLVDCDRNFVGELAERLRRAVESCDIKLETGSVKVTSSFGVALVEGEWLQATTLPAMIDQADKALYRAKHGGRNRVEFADPAASARPSVA